MDTTKLKEGIVCWTTRIKEMKMTITEINVSSVHDG